MDNENCAKTVMLSETDEPVNSWKVSAWNDNRHRYGWGKIRPAFLQFINRPWCFLLVIMCLSCVQGTAILGLLNIVSPQIEKRFSLSSTDIGLIAGANDGAALILGVFISYYGDFANKIRWISLGGLVTGFSLIAFTFPHYIAGRYNPPATVNTDITLCNLNHTGSLARDQCPKDSAVEWYYMAIFCIAQLFAGAGVLPLYSLTPSYMADNVSIKQTPIYMGFWYLSTFLGPAIGFALADPLLTLYVDIKQSEGLNLTPKDPRWIGNWWVGFLGCGVGLIVFSLLLLGYPAHFKPKEEPGKNNNGGTGQLTKEQFLNRKNIREVLRNFIASSKLLLTNITFVCICMGVNIPMFVGEGVTVFIAKILYLKHGVLPGNLGKTVLLMALPGMIVGTLLGSLVVSKFELKKSCKKSALICLLFQILYISVPFAFLIPGCSNPNLAGLAVDYGETLFDGSKYEFHAFNKSSAFLLSSCNDKCGCSLQSTLPLCGSDNISYLDPCHAGCAAFASHQPLTFANCSCIASSSPNGGSAKIGFCDAHCQNNWIYYVLLMGFSGFCFFMQLIPTRIVVMRCVPEDKIAFAIGMQYISMKVLANIPGPVVVGYFIDKSCDVWQDLCGQRGSCFVYDLDKLSMIIVQAFSSAGALSIVCFSLAWWFCKNYEDYSLRSDVNHETKEFLDNKEDKETTL